MIIWLQIWLVIKKLNPVVTELFIKGLSHDHTLKWQKMLEKILHILLPWKLKLLYYIIMTIGDQIRDEKLQYYINREAAKISSYYQAKLINMNILQVKQFCLLIKNK